MLSEEGWAAVWAQRDLLLRIARSRVATAEDAEDIVAEAMRRAGCQTDLPVQAIPAWLTRVTINLCTDHHRRQQTQRALLQRAELRLDAEPSHEERIVGREEAFWLARSLGELPQRQRQVLFLRADGHDNPTIAARLGLTVAAVEGLLKRSRAVLRQTLRAAGALLGLLWARTLTGRRVTVTAAVAVASMVATLLLMPSHPAAPPAVQAEQPATARQHDGLATVTHALRLQQLRTSRAATVPTLAAGGFDPRIGQAPPYDGPHCLVRYCLPVVDGEADRALGASEPEGWSPANLRDYFGEPAWSARTAARKPAVVIVSADRFDFTVPDLAVYRRTFHLPACGTADGCLRIIDPADQEPASSRAYNAQQHLLDIAMARTGGENYDSLPAVEQAQMLQGVSAACPECRLVLVRAATFDDVNVIQAFRQASRAGGVLTVSNLDASNTPQRPTVAAASWPSAPGLFAHGLVLSSGGVFGFTGGTGAAPRSFPDVISVGGTQVVGGIVEANPGNESFCNPGVPKPVWQRSAGTGCAGRAGTDLVAPGANYWRLAVYVSGGAAVRGWYHPGHNIQAAAIVAGLFARHHLDAIVHGPGDLYAHPQWFSDIIHGDTACTVAHACEGHALSDPLGCLPGAPQICYARRGWDGATGLGEPRHLPWL